MAHLPQGLDWRSQGVEGPTLCYRLPQVPGYKAAGDSASQSGSAAQTGAEQVSKDINKRLVAAMIERLRPGGDSASLVYTAQRLVEPRASSTVCPLEARSSAP